jgi:hypothetical protein
MKRTILTIQNWVNDEQDKLLDFESKWLADHRDMFDVDHQFTLTPEEWAQAYKVWRDDPRHA